MPNVTLRCYSDSDLRWLEEQAQRETVQYEVRGTCITLWNPPPYMVQDAKSKGITEDTNVRAKG